MRTIAQGTTVTLKHDIEFPNPLTGRHNHWKAGHGYWVGSPEYIQASYGYIEVCKRGKQMGTGMRFPLPLFEDHFEVSQ